MEIHLAGFNIDLSLLRKLKKSNSKGETDQSIRKLLNELEPTPETISAAYARISRSKKSVDKLRKDAMHGVAKARKSNNTIVFDMGHSSIAEHAVFNFDIIGISRYLMEFVQRTRLASYTEKSQRYVTLEGDFVTPEELEGYVNLKKEFVKLNEIQMQAYIELFEKLIDHYKNKKNSSIKTESLNFLNSRAKEDARYILPLSTKTQMGMTINARSLERLIKRLNALKFQEAKELASKLYKLVKNHTPSLIRYIEPSLYDRNLYETSFEQFDYSREVKNKLLDSTSDIDDKILASLLFRKTGEPPEEIMAEVKNMDYEAKSNIIKNNLRGLESYDSLPRSFEFGELTFQLNISSSCFAQLKRHRLSSILATDYNPKYGVVVPAAIKEANLEDKFDKAIEHTNLVHKNIAGKLPQIKNYVLTNAHKRLVLFKLNIRELCNFARLRQDEHAQWEIREVADFMVDEAKSVAPLTTKYISGKDSFSEVLEKIY